MADFLLHAGDHLEIVLPLPLLQLALFSQSQPAALASHFKYYFFLAHASLDPSPLGVVVFDAADVVSFRCFVLLVVEQVGSVQFQVSQCPQLRLD